MNTPDKTNGIEIVFIDRLSDFFRELKLFISPAVENVRYQHQPKPLPLWFRGNPDFSFELLPKLYRHTRTDIESYCSNKKNKFTLSNFWKLLDCTEKNLLSNFRVRNYHLIKRLPERQLTWMTIMQHYEMPTRLLDWSENIFAAFYFSLIDWFSTKPEHEGKSPCVWCLKPTVLNKYAKKCYGLAIDEKSLPDMLSFGGKSSTLSLINMVQNYRLIYYYYIMNEFILSRKKNCYPLAIHAPYNNERIRAQSGAFTLFPINTPKKFNQFKDLSMENLPDAGKFLRLFILRKPWEISFELKALGIKSSQFYPEIPSISFDIEQDIQQHSLE